MIHIEKGGNILLDTIGCVDVFNVAVNWVIKNNIRFDIDASAFLVTEDGFVRSHKDFVFYNQCSDTDQCVTLQTEPVDDNMLLAFDVSLTRIPKDIKKILFVLTIDDAEKLGQNFSMIDRVSLNICDNNIMEQSLLGFNIQADNQETSIMMGELYLYHGNWKFKAIGQGFKDGLGAIADKHKVDLQALYKDINQDSYSSPEVTDALKKKRKTPHEVLAGHTVNILKSLKQSIPSIQLAVENKLNESNTRMILDRIFTDAFGYKIDELKAEQKIQGRRADYILSINNTDTMVVEVKKAGMALRQKQIFQATSYGAYAGIKWALLTNLVCWNVYHISTEDRVEANCVFSVDLSNGVTEQDAELLVLISRYGLSRKSLLEKLWSKTRALSESSIISAILTDDVITKIRLNIKRDKGIHVSNEQVQESLEVVLRLD